jgi:hypothetical protein
MDAGTQNRGLIMLVWVLTVLVIVGLIVAFAVIHA